jgi:hypothetical protein
MSDTSAEGLKGTIERFENTVAIITLADGQKIQWPIKTLPDGCAVGSVVRLLLKTSESDQADREQLAKSILNEILRGDENKSS